MRENIECTCFDISILSGVFPGFVFQPVIDVRVRRLTVPVFQRAGLLYSKSALTAGPKGLPELPLGMRSTNRQRAGRSAGGRCRRDQSSKASARAFGLSAS